MAVELSACTYRSHPRQAARECPRHTNSDEGGSEHAGTRTRRLRRRKHHHISITSQVDGAALMQRLLTLQASR